MPWIVRASPHDRQILALAVPALGALAIDPLVSLVDTAFVGRLGAVPLAALGINVALFGLVFVVFNFLSYAVTPLVAERRGAGREEEAHSVIRHAAALALAIGVAAVVLVEAAAGPLAAAMGATGDLVEPTVTYLRIRATTAPAVLLVMVGHGAFRGYEDTRTPLMVSLAMNLVNLVLDPLLIFGAGWGLAGAAWATVAAQWTGGFVFAALLFHRRGLGVPWGGIRRSEMAGLVRIGGTLVVRTLSLVGAFTLATAVAARVGTVAVAAHQVAFQVWLLLALVVDAIAVAGQALIARHLGSGDPVTARAAADRMLQFGLLFGVVLGAAFWLLRNQLPGWFTDDREVVEAVRSLMIFVALMQPLNALVFVWDGIFLGAAGFRFLAATTAVSAAAATGLLLAVLPLGWGLTGVWWSIAAMMLVRATALAVAYARSPGLAAVR